VEEEEIHRRRHCYQEGQEDHRHHRGEEEEYPSNPIGGDGVWVWGGGTHHIYYYNY